MSKSLSLFGAAVLGTAGMLTVAANFGDRFVTPVPAQLRVAIAPEPAAPSAAHTMGFVTAANATEGDAMSFGLGREALPEEIAAWDIDVRPDGLGLPEGRGDVFTGEEVFVENCAMCHGDFGEAVGRWPALAGGQDTLTREDPVKTIGSYWPYLSTVYDYINRAMPFGNAQSLEPDQIYAITAYLLYVNDLVDEDFELSNENFTEIRLPNEGGFFMDDRSETELVTFGAEACMENCKDTVEITMRARVLDVTPETAEGAEDQAAVAEIAPVVVETASAEAALTENAPAETAPAEPAAVMTAALDPELVATGERVFRKCKACHQVGANAANRTGPQLNAVVGRSIGGVDGFNYSAALTDHGGVWDADMLHAFLENPRGAIPGTKMAFAGLRAEDERDAVIAYLQSLGQ